MNSPIKRHEYLKFLSHDHHQGLLLCWKIRMGLRNAVSSQRIRAYCIWFFENYLSPHFEIEESTVFPVLGTDHELVKKALADHRRIKRLLQNEKDILKSMNLLEEVLEKHIRFEERVLFAEVQNRVVPYELLKIASTHVLVVEEEQEWTDKFWLGN